MVQNNTGVSQELLTVDIGSLELDIFGLAKRNQRKATYVTLTKRMLAEALQNLPQIQMGVLESFLERIWQTQRDFNVSYHNDMHCLDVTQMTYLLLHTGQDNFSVQLQLSPVEQAAALIGAACHDFGHDGFNNAYHVKIQSDRFALYGEIGVQEQYHFAESFKVVQEMQLLSSLPADQQNLFKLRMQQCIMATDMSRHMTDLSEVKSICEQIPVGGKILPDDLPTEEREKRRQKVLELVVHASDISFLARPTEARRTQAYMLFEEFMRQGDEEQSRGLPISFLCDRATANVAKSQAPFVRFGPLPLFGFIGQLAPSKEYIAHRLIEGADEFDAYDGNESEEHKKSYIKRDDLGLCDSSWQ